MGKQINFWAQLRHADKRVAKRLDWLVNFYGRAGRGEFWTIYVLVTLAVMASSFAIETVWPAIPMKSVFWAVLTALLTLAVGVRRLHDRNRSGWWLAAFVYAPWKGASMMEKLAPTPTIIFGCLLLALVIWGVVEMFFLPGSKGANRFGPEPQPLAQPAV